MSGTVHFPPRQAERQGLLALWCQPNRASSAVSSSSAASLVAGMQRLYFELVSLALWLIEIAMQLCSTFSAKRSLNSARSHIPTP